MDQTPLLRVSGAARHCAVANQLECQDDAFCTPDLEPVYEQHAPSSNIVHPADGDPGAAADTRDTKTLLQSILDSVVTEGTFATGDQLPDAFPPSLLRVDGVGRIAFPLCPEQAVTLKAACSISPFGRGHDTVIDTNVRRSVEAPADKVHLSPAWTAAVNQLAIDACEKLDLSFAVDAHLYKLLLYEAGDFFLEHQDTEKEPGMFGTLLVQLPAEHTGGHLDVRHRGQTKRFGLDGPASADALHYCAFFADVHHAVAPLTSGHRLVLTYNLVRRGAIDNVAIPSNADLVCLARRAANRWTANPDKFVLDLDHEYTSVSATFATLKGKDRGLVNVLQEAELFELHLVLMEKHVVGLPCETHCGGYNKRRRYGRYEDYDDGADDGESAEMDEIHDETLRVLHWVNERNEQLKLASVQIQLESELVNNVDDVFEDMEPTQREYEGYTGNAGPTLEFTYRRALLVLWPRARSLEVAGVKSALSRVQSLVDSGDAASAESLLERIAAFAVAPTEPELATALQAAATIAARESAVAMLRRWAATPKAPVPSRSSYYDKQTPTDSTTTLVPAIAALIHSFGWTSSFKELISTTVAPRLGLAAVVQLAGAAPQAADTLLSTVNWTTTTLPLPSLSALHDLDANGRLPDRVFMQLVAKSDLSYGDMSTLVRRAIGQESPSSVFLAIALAQRPPDKTHTVPIATTLLSVPAAAALFVQSLLGPCQHASDSIVPGILETARQLSNTPAYQNLVSFRLRLLPGAKDAPPVKTWCQPSARLPSHPRVQDFLRGPTQTMTEVGFNGIAHARNFANKYFGAGVNRVTGASAMAEPYGTGQNARCDITKTDSYYKASLVKWKQRRDEGIALRQLLSAPFERVTVSIGADV